MAIDIDETRFNRNEFGVWLEWTLATAVGLMVGYLPSVWLVGGLELGLARVVVPLLAGVLIGVAQWLVLRQYVVGSHDWILNLAGGWVAGYALGLFVVQELSRSPLGALAGFILFGGIVALFQWPVLRREVPHIIPWILANVAGWTLGSYLSSLAGGAWLGGRHASLLATTLLTAGVTGLVAGAIIGLALVWTIRKPDLGE